MDSKQLISQPNLKRGIVGKVALNYTDVLLARELAGDFLFCRGLVAHKADDEVGGVGGELADELELSVVWLAIDKWVGWKSVVLCTVATYPDATRSAGDQVRRHGWVGLYRLDLYDDGDEC